MMETREMKERDKNLKSSDSRGVKLRIISPSGFSRSTTRLVRRRNDLRRGCNRIGVR
jgi:hypothetical protein